MVVGKTEVRYFKYVTQPFNAVVMLNGLVSPLTSSFFICSSEAFKSST